MNTIDLRAIRRLQGRTLKEQAALIGVNTSTVSRVEGGKQLPHLQNLRTMARVYQLGVVDFVTAIVAQDANFSEPQPEDIADSVSVARNGKVNARISGVVNA